MADFQTHVDQTLRVLANSVSTLQDVRGVLETHQLAVKGSQTAAGALSVLGGILCCGGITAPLGAGVLAESAVIGLGAAAGDMAVTKQQGERVSSVVHDVQRAMKELNQDLLNVKELTAQFKANAIPDAEGAAFVW